MANRGPFAPARHQRTGQGQLGQLAAQGPAKSLMTRLCEMFAQALPARPAPWFPLPSRNSMARMRGMPPPTTLASAALSAAVIRCQPG